MRGVVVQVMLRYPDHVASDPDATLRGSTGSNWGGERLAQSGPLWQADKEGLNTKNTDKIRISCLIRLFNHQLVEFSTIFLYRILYQMQYRHGLRLGQKI